MRILKWAKNRVLYSVHAHIARLASHAAIFRLRGVPGELRAGVIEELETLSRHATQRAHTARKNCEDIVKELDEVADGGTRKAQGEEHRLWTTEDAWLEGDGVPGSKAE